MNMLFLFSLIFIFLFFLGCIGQDPIVGCWEYKVLGTTSEMFFNSDGTFSIDSPLLKTEGTWERIDSERILIERKGLFNSDKTEIIYFNEKSKLIYHQDLPDAKFYNVECK
jgi:hypothetical protein